MKTATSALLCSSVALRRFRRCNVITVANAYATVGIVAGCLPAMTDRIG